MLLEHFLSIFTGAIFVIAVISGIGPQTLNIISHSINKNHGYTVAAVSFVADTVLIIASCLGLSLSNSHNLITIINYLGIIFITIYLAIKLKNLFKKHTKQKINPQSFSKSQSIIKALALTWLNPLVFIDTIIVIGGVASHYHGNKLIDFTLGATIGDFIWLFGLAYVARKFSHKLNRIAIWIALDIFSVLSMSIILYKTILIIIN